MKSKEVFEGGFGGSGEFKFHQLSIKHSPTTATSVYSITLKAPRMHLFAEYNLREREALLGED